jgi:hypothetical protein
MEGLAATPCATDPDFENNSERDDFHEQHA